MLLCMMYHHINSDKFSNKRDLFEKHLEYVATTFNVVLPRDKLNSQKNNLCLIFDDAYYDFYYFAFPLLKKYNMKAVLSIPVKYILDDTKLSADTRLNIKHSDMMRDSNYIKYAPFCTWSEINEMLNSNLVMVASHSFSHINLSQENIDLDLELKKSKEIIENKIKQSIESFTFPYGRFNEGLKSKVTKYYKFLFGIGGIDNRTWDGFNKILYRIYADDLRSCNDKLKPKDLLFYRLRRLKWQVSSIIQVRT